MDNVQVGPVISKQNADEERSICRRKIDDPLVLAASSIRLGIIHKLQTWGRVCLIRKTHQVLAGNAVGDAAKVGEIVAISDRCGNQGLDSKRLRLRCSNIKLQVIEREDVEAAIIDRGHRDDNVSLGQIDGYP